METGGCGGSFSVNGTETRVLRGLKKNKLTWDSAIRQWRGVVMKTKCSDCELAVIGIVATEIQLKYSWMYLSARPFD